MRDVDPYELLVRWYLRFNGYLGVENFVVHEPTQGGIRQGTETDVLAVRFPHSREMAGFAIENDPKLLDDQAIHEGLIDFVVAEVKAGGNACLNRVWRQPVDDLKIERVAYLLRWLGPLSDEESLPTVAKDLQANYRALHGRHLFRLVIFGHKPLHGIKAQQLTFRDIADFLVNVRAPCWQDRGLGARSPHDQWHPLIKELWKLADPGAGTDGQAKIEAILSCLEAHTDAVPENT